MTIVELRCAACEALIERVDDCYECVLSERKHSELASRRQVDSQFRKKTHCVHGHEFTPENTRMDVRHGSAYQVCRVCHNIRGKATRERRKSMLAVLR